MSCPYFCRYGADRMDSRMRGNDGLESAYFLYRSNGSSISAHPNETYSDRA